MRSPSIRLATPSGIDRKSLRLAAERFMAINAGRFERHLSGCTPAQRDCLVVLPLLFGVNHPLLPGFVDYRTPAGIVDFEPSTAAQAAAQRSFRGYQFQRDLPDPQAPLEALYLMVCVGSVGYTSTSDLDLWVCHRADLSADALALLGRKAAGIEAWAAQCGLELHVFRVNAERFRGGTPPRLSDESSGSAQHRLLLDEFYRTALLLAGRYPIWWLIPSDRDPHHLEHAEHLRSRRFVKPGTTIDFGPADPTPQEEFVGAGIWQLFKGIDAPYKSILKLLLLQSRVEDPHAPSLSSEFKAAVLEGETDLDVLDPYVRLYHRVEAHLLRANREDRLDLARRCLYYKAGVALSRLAPGSRLSWRARVLHQLTTDWGWDADKLRALDERDQWSLQRFLQEHHALVTELNYGYRLLSRFGQQHQLRARIHSEDFALLGRRLRSTFERRAGKVELLGTGLSRPLLAEVFLHRVATSGIWQLHTSPPERGGQPVREAREPTELLAWLHGNGLIDADTQLRLNSPTGNATATWAVQCLRQWRPGPFLPAPLEQYRQPAEVSAELWLINLAAGPMTQLHQRGYERVSSQVDALAYSGLRTNLVRSIDAFAMNSWEELVCDHSSGDGSLPHALARHLNRVATNATPPMPEVRAAPSGHSRTIELRVAELCATAQAQFIGEHGLRPGRRLFEIAGQPHAIECLGQAVEAFAFDSPEALWAHLQTPLDRFVPLVVEPGSWRGTPIAAIAELNQPGRIEITFRCASGRGSLWITDERGAVVHVEREADASPRLVAPWYDFIERILDRETELHGQARPEVALFELSGIDSGSHRAERRGLDVVQSPVQFTLVEAAVLNDSESGPRYQVRCGLSEFTQHDAGDGFFRAAAAAIFSGRSSGERYPFYISDLDLGVDPSRPAPTASYLCHKLHLEAGLNQVLLNA